jgi:SAM-dependent methyltransferase
MNSYVVPAEIRYQKNDYSYDSGNSKIAINHFTQMAQDVSNRAGLNKGDLVVDIGSNIGTLLEAFKNLGAEIQGIDPAPNIVSLARERGIPTINDFFSVLACQEVLKRGKAKIITSTNAFNHISNLSEFMNNILSILDEKGVFVIELPYFLQVLEKKHFDVIYLEHVSYIAIKPLVNFFAGYGLQILHAEENDYMSGSIRIFVGKGVSDKTVDTLVKKEVEAGLYDLEKWNIFSEQIKKCKIKLLKSLLEAREKGGKIVAIGAAAKGNTLLNYCGIDSVLIDFVTDSSPLKIGKYTPGSHLPIFSDDAITPEFTHALILAWNISDFLKSKISPKFPYLDFITPHVVE